MGIFYMMIKPNLRTELFCTNMTCSMSLAKSIFEYLSFLLNGNSNLNITLRYSSHVPCSLVICLLPLLFNTILFSHSLQRKCDINEYTSDGVILQTWHFFLFCHIYCHKNCNESSPWQLPLSNRLLFEMFLLTCYLVICYHSLHFTMNLFSHPVHSKTVKFLSETQQPHSPLLCFIHFFVVQFLILSPVPISSMSNKSKIGVDLQSWTDIHICFLI